MPSMLFACALLALLGLGASCSFIVPRSEWKALPSECSKQLQHPVRYVVISHTAGSSCKCPDTCEQQARNVQSYHMKELGWCDVAYNLYLLFYEEGVVISHTAGSSCKCPDTCEQQARNVQSYHMKELGWCDVAYNFLIGEDGHVYEGRGWNTKGDHTGPTWNPMSIGITFMGNYMDRVPAKRALRAALNLLKCGVSQGFLRSNYEVKGHRDVQSTLSPGDQLYEVIQRWDHYRE